MLTEKLAFSQMKHTVENFKNKVLFGVGAIVLMSSSASAALAVAPIATEDFLLVATTIITATGVFFGIRKAIGLMGR